MAGKYINRNMTINSITKAIQPIAYAPADFFVVRE